MKVAVVFSALLASASAFGTLIEAIVGSRVC